LFGIFFISYLINWFFFVSLFVFSSWYNLFGFDFFGFFSRFLFCHNFLFKIFFFFFFEVREELEEVELEEGEKIE